MQVEADGERREGLSLLPFLPRACVVWSAYIAVERESVGWAWTISMLIIDVQ